MKKKILIFGVIFLIIISITFVIINIKFKNNSNEKTPEEVINEKTINILSEENTDIIGNLKIESIELNAPIKDGTEMSVLKTAIGHFNDTPYFNGNICLAAHNRGYNQNFFERLNEVQKGDKVEYITKYATYEYEVTDIKVIEETDLTVLNPTVKDQITMITCIANQRDKRLCVVASKV